MAVDQALLETAESTGLATLRMYRWKEPTLSLGYFQSYQDRDQHEASRGCGVVRRKTGGGAIVHHHDLTYSLTIPNQNRWSQKNEDLYHIVHQVLIEQWGSQGVQTRLFADAGQGSVTGRVQVDNKAFLCFLRRSSGDIVCGDWKITGSAQRRLKNSLLQHGSILMRRSEFAPELEGLEEQVGQSFDWQKFETNLIQRIEKRLHLTLSRGSLSDGELEIAQLRQKEFEQSDWLRSR